jgi:TRAP-type C4-dicarboxylate transport system permease small subunit
MEWSMGYLYSIVPMSGALMFVFALEHLLGVLRGGSLPQQGAAHDPHAVPQAPAAGKDEQRPDQWL